MARSQGGPPRGGLWQGHGLGLWRGRRGRVPEGQGGSVREGQEGREAPSGPWAKRRGPGPLVGVTIWRKGRGQARGAGLGLDVGGGAAPGSG